MPYIRVVYRKKGFDYIPAYLLNVLIRLDEVTHFYRPSEKRWISIRFDWVRGTGGLYTGPERRSGAKKTEPGGEKGGEGRAAHWLDQLWRQIGAL